MGAPFTPLPPETFPEKARPHIARLNRFLLDLSRVEGVLRSPTTDSAKSDQTVQRAIDPAVAISRVTPTPSSGASGASVSIGTPALSLSTSNAPGSTTSVLSTNSQIALFGLGLPAGVSTGYGVGSSAYAARADHVHGLTDGITVQMVRVAVDGVVGSTRPTINFIQGSSIAIALSDNAGANRADLTVGFSGAVGGAGAHNILSATHSDSNTASAQRGDVITGQSIGGGIAWARLAAGSTADRQWFESQPNSEPAWSGVTFEKCILVETPTAAEDLTIWHNPEKIEVTEIRGVLQGGSASTVTLDVKWASDRSAAGTSLLDVPTALTNATTGQTFTLGTTQSNRQPTANSYVWLETSSGGGTGTAHISVKYKRVH